MTVMVEQGWGNERKYFDNNKKMKSVFLIRASWPILCHSQWKQWFLIFFIFSNFNFINSFAITAMVGQEQGIKKSLNDKRLMQFDWFSDFAQLVAFKSNFNNCVKLTITDFSKLNISCRNWVATLESKIAIYMTIYLDS